MLGGPQNKKHATQRGRVLQNSGGGHSVGDENRLDLRLHLLLGLSARDGDLLDDERARRVEHAPLTEGELLVGLQAVEVAQNLRDVVDRARLDLVHEPTIATVPRLVVECDRPLAEDVEDLPDLLLADHLAKTDRARVGDRDHDLSVRVENSKNIESLTRASDV